MPIDTRNQFEPHDESKVDLMSLYGALPKPEKTLIIDEMNQIIGIHSSACLVAPLPLSGEGAEGG